MVLVAEITLTSLSAIVKHYLQHMLHNSQTPQNPPKIPDPQGQTPVLP
jgi:hypothetical protein